MLSASGTAQRREPWVLNSIVLALAGAKGTRPTIQGMRVQAMRANAALEVSAIVAAATLGERWDATMTSESIAHRGGIV